VNIGDGLAGLDGPNGNSMSTGTVVVEERDVATGIDSF
jgi:hypothetical protein